MKTRSHKDSVRNLAKTGHSSDTTHSKPDKAKPAKSHDASRERRRDIAVDFLTDVAIELRTQATKTLLLMVAVALSVGALVASVGITNNAAHAIDAELAASTGRQILIQLAENTAEGEQRTAQSSDSVGEAETDNGNWNFPADAISRLQNLGVVENVGMSLPLSSLRATTVERKATKVIRDNQDVKGVTSQYFAADEVCATGAVSLMDSDLPVAMLGEQAAETYGISHSNDLTGVTLNIDGRQFAVVGFVAANTAAIGEVFIPYSLAREIAGSDSESQVLVRSQLGAGPTVASTARLALRPDKPEILTASQIVSAGKTRNSVSDVLGKQAAWIGGFLLILTMLLITNSMVVSVTSRTTEIGIRRALGASRADVAATFLLEGFLVGFLGGLAGSVLSALVVVVVSAVSGWSAFLSIMGLIAGPVLGAIVGVMASAYPAARAARIRPALAVRAD